MKITKAEARLLAGALAEKWVEVRTLMLLPGVEDPQAQRIGKRAQKILDRLNEVRKFAGPPIKGGAIRLAKVEYFNCRKCGGAIGKDRVDDPCESDGCLHRP